MRVVVENEFMLELEEWEMPVRPDVESVLKAFRLILLPLADSIVTKDVSVGGWQRWADLEPLGDLVLDHRLDRLLVRVLY